MKHSIWIAFVYALLSCAMVASAHAGLEDLLTVTSDQTEVKSTQVEAILDSDGQVTGMTVFGNRYTMDQLRVGATVYSKKVGFLMVPVLILKGSIDSAKEEGTFTVKFFTSFNFGSYKYSSCPFEVHRDPNRGDWFVLNSFTGREVKKINVVATSSGVVTLDGICQ